MADVDAKDSLRRELETKRASLSPVARAQEEDLVNAAIQASRFWSGAEIIALYRAHGSEISPTGMTNGAWRDGRRTVFPRVTSGNQLVWHEATSWDDFEEGYAGIMEPRAHLPTVEASQIGLFVVPGVGFSKSGQRLGLGGGYYDRELGLASQDAVTVGIAFDCQVVDQLPVEPHDMPVNHVLTHSSINMFMSA